MFVVFANFVVLFIAIFLYTGNVQQDISFCVVQLYLQEIDVNAIEHLGAKLGRRERNQLKSLADVGYDLSRIEPKQNSTTYLKYVAAFSERYA